jgi:hypothetical protein
VPQGKAVHLFIFHTSNNPRKKSNPTAQLGGCEREIDLRCRAVWAALSQLWKSISPRLPFFFIFLRLCICARLCVLYVCKRGGALIRARPLGSHGRAWRRRHGTLIAGRSQIKFCHHWRCHSVSLWGPARNGCEHGNASLNCERRMQIINLWSFACHTRAARQINSAISQAPGYCALLYWFSQKQLNFASSWSFKLRMDRHLCFRFICMEIGQSMTLCSIKYPSPTKRRAFIYIINWVCVANCSIGGALLPDRISNNYDDTLFVCVNIWLSINIIRLKIQRWQSWPSNLISQTDYK